MDCPTCKTDLERRSVTAQELIDAQGLHALSRETGVTRNCLRRLRDGKGVNLETLVSLVESIGLEDLAVECGGSWYRLERVPDAPELGENRSDPDMRRSTPKLLRESEPKAAKAYDCDSCGGEIVIGETHRVQTYTSQADGLQTYRHCWRCVDGTTHVARGSHGAGEWSQRA